MVVTRVRDVCRHESNVSQRKMTEGMGGKKLQGNDSKRRWSPTQRQKTISVVAIQQRKGRPGGQSVTLSLGSPGQERRATKKKHVARGREQRDGGGTHRLREVMQGAFQISSGAIVPVLKTVKEGNMGAQKGV